MGFDALFKRYFPAVICLLIALAAYFQAAGMGQLVVASVALDPASVPVTSPGPRSRVPLSTSKETSEHTTSAKPLLARNAFDSVTGPLDEKPLDMSAQQEKVVTNKDPYGDPHCDFAKVLVIVSSNDETWSFAALAGSDNKSQLRRKGDEFGGHTVYFIGDLRSDEQKREMGHNVYDRVWMTAASGARCQLKIGGPPPKGGPAAAAPAASEAMGRPSKSTKVPAEIASKITKVSETEYNVDRSVLEALRSNQGLLMKSARVIPEKEGDKVVGIRLFGIRQDSLLPMIGIQNGDRLNNINGFDLSDPQKALEMYARIGTMDRLTMSINRQGKPMTIDINVK
jgi:general secretion pathway protein C